MRRALCLCLWIVFGSAAALSQANDPEQFAGEPSPPELRLGQEVRPTRYRAQLTIVPGEDAFNGQISIELDIQRRVPVIWLNATDLTVRKAAFVRDGRAIPADVVAGDEDFLGFEADDALESGPARLEISYSGRLYQKDLNGIFKVREGSDWYVFTQFEPLAARRAFPCFDEPSFKVPWQLTLRVPAGHIAVSNTPVTSETGASSGIKTVEFAETKPLPSYLIALAVGPFERVDAGAAGRKKTPVGIITPRGKRSEAAYAAEATPRILELLEDYFGTPYPYEKLDSIAVPMFFGAMEHPGLVTYAQTLILSQPERDTIQRKRGYAGTCAHELAHQWFGNLVTTAWWDDIWLNEAFASWLANKIVGQWKPEWEVGVGKLAGRSSAMNNDSLATARRIRQPIHSKHDIVNAFDGITYAKGQAVLDMFEAWIGPEKFRQGVRSYLDTHAWRNAASEDFLAALSAGGDRGVAAAFSTFLDQSGVPLVAVELNCQQGAPPKLVLTQQRYRRLGSEGAAEQTWRIPVCLKFPSAMQPARECMLMTEPSAELELPSAGECPDWVLANADSAGYYRVLYNGDLLNRLVEKGAKHLTTPELVGTIRDIEPLVRSGHLSAADALSLIPLLVTEETSNRHVISSTMGMASSFERIVPDDLRSNYARFIRKIYGPKARELGWVPRPEDDDETRLLRRSLLRLVADEGRDAALIEEAGKLAVQWAGDRGAVDNDVVNRVLAIAAKNGDGELFDRFHAEAKKTRDRRERQWLLAAMGSFRDPAVLRKAFELILTEEFDIRESLSILFAAAGEPSSRPLAYEFMKQNFDQIATRLPRALGDYTARLPYVGAGFCDEKSRADLRTFFHPRSSELAGGPRILAQVLEEITLCIAFKDAQQASLASFLEKY